MKKINFVKFAAIALAAGALSQGAFAADGTINFTGEITDSPCTVSPNSQNMTVPLGNVGRTWFDTNSKGPVKTFTIDLLGCGASAKGATVSFSGVADLDDATSLAISNAGQVGVQKATGVAVEIGDSTRDTKINLGSTSQEYVLGQGDNALQFYAAYVKTLPTVTVGPANAVAQFTVAYP